MTKTKGKIAGNVVYLAMDDEEAATAVYNTIRATPHSNCIEIVNTVLKAKYGIVLKSLEVIDAPPYDHGGPLRCRFWFYGPKGTLLGIFVYGDEEDRGKKRA